MQQKLALLLRRYRPHVAETLQLSVPVVIGQLGHVLMGLTDTLMVGQLEDPAYLSAAALGNGLYIIPAIFGIGLTFAITPLTAEAEGSGDRHKAVSYVKQGFWIAWLVWAGLLAIIALIAGSLAYLDQPPRDTKLAYSYMLILGFSLLPNLIFLVFKQFSDGLSRTMPAMFITLAGLIVNIFANWLLIYGNWGFPRLELDGAGYGTLFSRLMMVFLMAGFVLFNTRFRKYPIWEGWRKWDPPAARKIIAIGVPSGLQYFFEIAAFAGAAVMIGWMDRPTESRAAHQIAIQLASATYMVVTGIAAGATIRVSTALGRRDYQGLREAGNAGLMLAAGFMLLAAAAFILGRNVLPGWFTREGSVLALAASLMIIAAFFQLFDGIQAVAVSVLRGMQDTLIPTLITLAAYWGVGLGGSWLFGITLGLNVTGVWYAFVLSLGSAALALTWRFRLLSGKLIEQAEPLPSARQPEPAAPPA